MWQDKTLHEAGSCLTMGPDGKIILDIFSDRVYLEGVKEKLDFISSYQLVPA